MNMEFINRVELQGIIGSERSYQAGASTIHQFNIAMNRIYRTKDGVAVVETTWVCCQAEESRMSEPDAVRKGNKVHLVGRLRQHRFTTETGEERYGYEVLVEKLEEIGDHEG